MIKGYWKTKTLCERYQISARTLSRWQKREHNPFPSPRIQEKGSQDLYAIDDVLAWEESAHKKSA